MVNNDHTGYGKTIQEFMQRYESHFRAIIQGKLSSALRSVGFMGGPEVLLIGVQAHGTDALSIYIDPEDGPYRTEDLARVPLRAEEFYQCHPNRETKMVDWDGGNRYITRFHESLRKQMLGNAIEEALASTSAGEGRAFIAGFPAPINAFSIYAVVGLDRTVYQDIPHLATVQNFPPRRLSLVDAIISDVLERTVRALQVPMNYIDPLEADSPEIVQRATSSFIASVLSLTGNSYGKEANALLCSLSTLPYEGRTGSGRLIIAKPDHSAVDISVRFNEPIRLDDTRAVRKLLEASGPAGNLLSTGRTVYGIGQLVDGYIDSDTLLFITLNGRGSWDLSLAGKTLLSVRDGLPSLPKNSLNTLYFADLVERLMPGANLDLLTSLAQAAVGSMHGAMLIISSDAANEARRLAPQAWTVEPVELNSRLLGQITSMDGGILIDPQGNCHAIGVIVDGVACGRENPARGSRFNNAVRYLESKSPLAVIVVYSVDGSIDILPALKPRIKRSTVQQLVDRYLALAEPGKERSGLSEALDSMRRVQFYLSDEQCARINAVLMAQEKWNRKNTQAFVRPIDFVSNADMDESYWLPEEH